jgi:hypothetical protein
MQCRVVGTDVTKYHDEHQKAVQTLDIGSKNVPSGHVGAGGVG